MRPVPAPTIVLYGNIASGKSTLAGRLQQALPHWHYACMDQLRVEGDRADHALDRFTLDRLCEQRLMAMLAQDLPVIYESSGATRIFREAIRFIEGWRRGPRVLIRTTCSFHTAMVRFSCRKAAGHHQLRPAVRSPMPIEDCWHHFQDRINLPPTLLIDTETTGPLRSCLAARKHIDAHIPPHTHEGYVA